MFSLPLTLHVLVLFLILVFIDLLNNYIKETNVPENETFNEIVEQQKFMTQVLFSDIGYKVFKTLVQNGVVNSYQEYWDRFYQLWFEPYFRSSKRRYVWDSICFLT